MNLFRFQQFESYQRGSSRFMGSSIRPQFDWTNQICRIGISAGPLGRNNILQIIKRRIAMKYTRAILVLSVLITALSVFCVHAQNAPATADELLQRFEAAMKAKNASAVMTLLDWQGVSEDMKVSQQQIIGMICSQEVTSVKLSPLPANFRLEFERDGIRYRPNVAVVGVIDIQYAQKGNIGHMPYGKKDNAFYLSNTIQERISQPVTKEISLNISIAGTVLPKPVAFEGFYVYLKGGKEIRESILDTSHAGNYCHAFWGDHIKSCVVWKKSLDGKIQLLINENGKVVFESEWETSNKPIVYEIKHY